MRKLPPKAKDIEVGQRIRIARVAKSMSQEKLADALGLTFQQVQKYEKGTNRIAPSRLEIVARTLERPMSWFFGETNGARAEAMAPYEMLGSTRQGQRLAKAFLEIDGNHFRETIVDLVEAAATASAQ